MIAIPQLPREGTPHAADHCLVAPIVDKNGVLRFFALAKAHQADCGNSRPSTYLADVADVYEEGALIFRGEDPGELSQQ